jgi:hypothetical protein
MNMRITTSDARTIYTRALPGGGYVAIRAREVHRLFRDPICRGEIVVERRDQKRRVGHVPPTVMTSEAHDVATLWRELFPVACSNTALARACMRASPSYVRHAVA